MLRHAALVCLLLSAAGAARAQNVLTLEQALAYARQHAPELQQAKASVDAAVARADIARAPTLPQLSGSAGYTRSTFNSTGATAATGGGTTGRSRDSLDMRSQFNAGLRVSQLVFDFGQTRNGLRAARASAEAQVETARGTGRDVEYGVRGAFLDAAAARALVQVAEETLANQTRHLEQIQGFVEVGTRPQIDLASARTGVANARLVWVRAQNTYGVAKRQLERAMGFAPSEEYDVSDELPAAEPDEDAGIERLLQLAEQARPEFAALAHQVRAQELTVSAAEAGNAPAIDVVGNLEESGPAVDALAFNAGLGVSLSWPIFAGGVTGARVHEARAQLMGVRVQREILRKDTRLQLEQAALSLRAAQDALEIASEVVVNARERLSLAEGRYSAGVGNVIELADAQLVLSEAESQRVGAAYDVGQARLQLRKGLGR